MQKNPTTRPDDLKKSMPIRIHFFSCFFSFFPSHCLLVGTGGGFVLSRGFACLDCLCICSSRSFPNKLVGICVERFVEIIASVVHVPWDVTEDKDDDKKEREPPPPDCER